MKNTILTSCCIGLFFISFSQQNITSSGGNSVGTGGIVSYSIGQVDYMNSTGSNGTFNHGVQQPFEFFEDVGLDENELIQISLFPNPSHEIVILKLNSFIENLTFALFDLEGKIVLSGKIKSKETQLDMRSCSSGEYHLSINNQLEKTHSFKLIKY